MADIATLTTADFDEKVIKSDKPYLVDFWASWCGPCRAVAPIVEQIAEENADKLRVGKLNVDEEQCIAQRFRVMSIPTIILFKDGEPVSVQIGALPKEELFKALVEYL